MMKVALPSEQNMVAGHFGHCEYFTVFTINEKKEIVAEETIQSPAGCGCKSNIAHTLSQTGVEYLLAGNMGAGAVNVLNGHGIKVLRGCAGDLKMVVQNWLAGTLVDSEETCHAHDHGHGCHH
jgi:predicted Fe-Mo cluster-binding NifX family protein